MTPHKTDETHYKDYFAYVEWLRRLLKRAESLSFGELDRLTDAVRRAYSSVPEVLQIYRCFEIGDLSFWVLTREIDVGDNTLMDVLSTHEQRLLKAYPEEWLSFHFYPAAYIGDIHDVTWPDAVCIYQAVQTEDVQP